MPRKGGHVKIKNYERKIKLLFIIYADFRENNGMQNPEESNRNIYQKHLPCSYGYKLVCVDDKFSELFKTYLGEDDVYNFTDNIIKERKHCSDVIKKNFNKELLMTKENNEDFKNST